MAPPVGRSLLQRRTALRSLELLMTDLAAGWADSGSGPGVRVHGAPQSLLNGKRLWKQVVCCTPAPEGIMEQASELLGAVCLLVCHRSFGTHSSSAPAPPECREGGRWWWLRRPKEVRGRWHPALRKIRVTPAFDKIFEYKHLCTWLQAKEAKGIGIQCAGNKR